MTIRPAARVDIPRLAALLCQTANVHADTRPDIFRHGARKYSDKQLRTLLKSENTPIFVAVNELDEAVGYAFCVILEQKGHPLLTDLKSLYIDDLCVDETMRATGIGTALFAYVVEYAKSLGCYNITLNVWAKNEKARRFYERCGLSVQKIGMEMIL